MDVALLLFLPLIGGYVFTTHWNYTRYKSAVEEGQRLYFRAAQFAVIMFGLSLSLHLSLMHGTDGYKELITKEASRELAFLVNMTAEEVSSQALRLQLVLVSIYSFVLGVVLWIPLNILFWILWSMYVWNRKRLEPETNFLLLPPFFMEEIQDDEFEKLIVTAAARPMPIAFTLETGNVFVGYVLYERNPTFKRKDVTILPLMSGVRDPEGHIQFHTFYSPIYSKINDSTKALQHLSEDDFKKVIPIARICSSNLFDIEAYEYFLGYDEKKKSTKTRKKVKKKMKTRR